MNQITIQGAGILLLACFAAAPVAFANTASVSNAEAKTENKSDPGAGAAANMPESLHALFGHIRLRDYRVPPEWMPALMKLHGEPEKLKPAWRRDLLRVFARSEDSAARALLLGAALGKKIQPEGEPQAYYTGEDELQMMAIETVGEYRLSEGEETLLNVAVSPVAHVDLVFTVADNLGKLGSERGFYFFERWAYETAFGPGQSIRMIRALGQYRDISHRYRVTRVILAVFRHFGPNSPAGRAEVHGILKALDSHSGKYVEARDYDAPIFSEAGDEKPVLTVTRHQTYEILWIEPIKAKDGKFKGKDEDWFKVRYGPKHIGWVRARDFRDYYFCLDDLKSAPGAKSACGK